MASKRPTTVSFINNKGGVGKTTLACNMAHYLANHGGQRVLMLDLDPQCNATQLMLSDEQWDNLFGGTSAKSEARTILHPLRNLRQGDSTVETDFEVTRSERFGVDVLPGHPSLALLEDSFSQSWVSFLAGEPAGARRTHWIWQLLRDADRYDVVVIDAGPSLGALNRSIVLGSQAIVTPTAADLFSLFALDNIAEWIKRWSVRYGDALVAAKNSSTDPSLGDVPGVVAGIAATYLGYTVQQYVTKSVKAGERRSVNSYDQYKREIPNHASRLVNVTRTARTSDLQLGIVPHMFSMIPLAQSRHAPIGSLTTADGLRGAQISQQANYRQQLDDIGEKLQAALAEVSA